MANGNKETYVLFREFNEKVLFFIKINDYIAILVQIKAQSIEKNINKIIEKIERVSEAMSELKR